MVDEAILIAASPDWLYRFCRDLGNMRQFAPRLRGIEALGDRYARLRLWSPQGRILEWESTITSDEPGRAIAWRTTYESQLSHLGAIRFERDADDGGTVVTVQLEYLPPLGAVGSAVVRTIGPSPRRLVRDALARLKQIAKTDGAANGDQPRGAGDDPGRIEA
ncbi:MAG: SRPBCC family protein [Burkholderiales bacterium]